MVSKRDGLLIAAAVALVAVVGGGLFGTKSGGKLIQSVFGARDPDIPPPINPNAEQITGLKQILGQAQTFFRKTFPPARNPADRCNHPSCKRGPNLLGSLAARGTVIGIDPFTGGMAQVGFTPRFNFGKISGFTLQNILNNAEKFRQGNIVKSEFSSFITGIKEQIGILEGTNIVTL